MEGYGRGQHPCRCPDSVSSGAEVTGTRTVAGRACAPTLASVFVHRPRARPHTVTHTHRVGVNRYNFLLESLQDLDARWVLLVWCKAVAPKPPAPVAAPATGKGPAPQCRPAVAHAADRGRCA